MTTSPAGPETETRRPRHPYGLGTNEIAELARVAEQWGLDVLINGTRWYGHGTTFVQLAPAGGS